MKYRVSAQDTICIQKEEGKLEFLRASVSKLKRPNIAVLY